MRLLSHLNDIFALSSLLLLVLFSSHVIPMHKAFYLRSSRMKLSRFTSGGDISIFKAMVPSTGAAAATTASRLYSSATGGRSWLFSSRGKNSSTLTADNNYSSNIVGHGSDHNINSKETRSNHAYGSSSNNNRLVSRFFSRAANDRPKRSSRSVLAPPALPTLLDAEDIEEAEDSVRARVDGSTRDGRNDQRAAGGAGGSGGGILARLKRQQQQQELPRQISVTSSDTERKRLLRGVPAGPARADSCESKRTRDAVDHETAASPSSSSYLSPPDGMSYVFNDFSKLGVYPDMVTALAKQDITVPTPVQKLVIPRLTHGENILFTAGTGTGKTYAYLMPAIQRLIEQERGGYIRQTKRPRCVILAPTRELARQILNNIKSLSHYCKISSSALMGGEDYGIQKTSLDRLVDIVVASPGRLLQHRTRGFGDDIREVLKSVLYRQQQEQQQQQLQEGGDSVDEPSDPSAAGAGLQVMMTSATLSKPVRLLLDNNKDDLFEVLSDSNKTKQQQHFLGGSSTQAGASGDRIPIRIIEVEGTHKSLPNVRHVFENTKGTDKLVLLDNVLSKYSPKKFKTIIFCNTVLSCRAVHHRLVEAGNNVVSYHGELTSDERQENLLNFKDTVQYLVCTDLAARGLDIPEVDHVVMFDFPLNSIDYLHRTGRCGRAGRSGLVTSLLAKRDAVLGEAIKNAIAQGQSLDGLTSSRKDYEKFGKLSDLNPHNPKPKSDFGRADGSTRGRSLATASAYRRQRDPSSSSSPSSWRSDRRSSGRVDDRRRSASPDGRFGSRFNSNTERSSRGAYERSGSRESRERGTFESSRDRSSDMRRSSSTGRGNKSWGSGSSSSRRVGASANRRGGESVSSASSPPRLRRSDRQAALRPPSSSSSSRSSSSGRDRRSNGNGGGGGGGGGHGRKNYNSDNKGGSQRRSSSSSDRRRR